MTVRELLRSISSAELTEWDAFCRLEQEEADAKQRDTRVQSNLHAWKQGR